MIQAVEDMGKLDNTLIIYISGDNGASAEGTPNGTPSEVLQFNGVELPVADADEVLRRLGHRLDLSTTWRCRGPGRSTRRSSGPSRCRRFFGGTRQGMAISWPGRIKDKGGIRWQFHHVIDIVPTILEATGIPAPVMVDGIAQKPIEGVSMAYTFDKANADAPSPHTTQYFEMMGVQGLYNDGWMLSAVPIRPPWELLGTAIQDPASGFKFELYDVRKDWTQYNDVAAQNPAKIKEMTDLMFARIRQSIRCCRSTLRSRRGWWRRVPARSRAERCSPIPASRSTGIPHGDGAEPSQHVLHDHRRHRRAAGRRRRA